MDGDPPEWTALLILGLIPIITTLGTIAANELKKWYERGFKLW